MIPCQRHLFDIPDDIAYLNCAYMSPLMTRVVDAMARGTAGKVHPWTYWPADFFTHAETARGGFARLIGGGADDVAIVPSASYGVAIAANALPVGKDAEIIVLADQFPSNVYPWREKARDAGAQLTALERPSGGDWTEIILNALTPRTAIVALPHCHWTDGSLIDLVKIGAAVRENGAALVLDLTQSLGALPFDVTEVQPDFMVAAGYKWMLGPYTLGYLYVAPRWQEAEPLEHNWINRAGSEDFSRLIDYQDGFQPGARRFDMGERANAGQLMGSIAAMDQINDWTPEAISRTLGARNRMIAERAEKLGLNVGNRALSAPHFIGLRIPGGVPDGLLAALAAKGVFVSMRGDALRVTPHLYNTDADIDRFFGALETGLG